MFFLACVYGARGRHHTAQMESWTTASVECGVECVETCAFFPFSEKKIQNRPKMRFEPIFSPHRCSILSRRAWRVAPVAASGDLENFTPKCVLSHLILRMKNSESEQSRSWLYTILRTSFSPGCTSVHHLVFASPQHPTLQPRIWDP